MLKNPTSMIGARRQNSATMFLTRVSPASLLDGRRIRIRNRRYIVWDTEKASLNKLQTNSCYLAGQGISLLLCIPHIHRRVLRNPPPKPRADPVLSNQQLLNTISVTSILIVYSQFHLSVRSGIFSWSFWKKWFLHFSFLPYALRNQILLNLIYL
jgi:hypothetical protein